MRFVSVIVVLACAAMTLFQSGAHASHAAEVFPYTAYINADDVYIRSGPGKNYYPTDKIPKGEPVEIYRHDPGGWYAIRPPQGSFSWVQADILKPTGDRIAVCQKDQAPCFVGTRFSTAHDVHQVRLDKGEQVEILEIRQIGDGPQAQNWCQISPPSGEFRWISGKFVDRAPPSGVSRQSNADRNSRTHDSVERTAQNTSWVAKGSGASNATADVSDATTSTRSTGGGATWQSTGSKKAVDDKPPPVADPFQSELSAIDLDVSRIAADDQSTWEFTSLRRRAEALLPRADTALERGRVRLVLNRIARFEDVKRRYDMLNQPGSAIASTRASVLPVADANRYDGIGRLTPVVSQRPNAPRFALVDDTNQVVSFVTPAPGVNLQPYVGKAVGINGQRGYMPELGKPHVTAQRIALFDTPILR